MNISHALLLLTVAFATACAPADEDSNQDDDVRAACPPPANYLCEAPLPEGSPAGFQHVMSKLVTHDEDAHHRGRDSFLRPSDTAWAMAKFAYGARDLDVKGETVDVYLLKGCAGSFQKVGTVSTTHDGEHETVSGVADTGGRVYLNLGKLPVGRHRVHFVLKGDASRTDAYIEVLKPDQKVFVSDIDGTLTSSEFAELPALLKSELPAAHEGASAALKRLTNLGYRPFYLTARPEALGERSRAFLKANGFPPGILHTTLSFSGAIGEGAKAFKAAELADLKAQGMKPVFAIGNQASDAEAFTTAGIASKSVFLYQRTDDMFGCTRFESYTALLPIFGKAPSACVR
jgi:phosphatidate phosphatase PAH1